MLPSPLADPRALAMLRARLLTWYAGAHRDFPWRRTSDPYAVLVSEVMLQQTQAARVALRFPAFLERFPTPAALARAPEAEVLAAWSGLGYNRRALALRRTATIVARQGWPQKVDELEALPGIGPYTARAVASLAFGRSVGAVDTNVRRWLTRRFGLGPTAAARDLQLLADALAAAGNAAHAASWTHATMEFGAAVCTSRNPRCNACPIAIGCPSRGDPAVVPVPRQPTFAGSDRARRGALLRALSSAPDHAMALTTARRLVGGDSFDNLVNGLQHDGLVHRSAGRLRLGGAPEATATIEA